jgi:hypothetical protein
MVCFGETHVFLQARRIGLLGANASYLHLEAPKFQEVPLSKLIQFSQGNNVLHALASNTNGFLLRDIYFFSTQLNRTIWKMMSHTPP